eukprot:1317561-Amphidinium_carterae.1
MLPSSPISQNDALHNITGDLLLASRAPEEKRSRSDDASAGSSTISACSICRLVMRLPASTHLLAPDNAQQVAMT